MRAPPPPIGSELHLEQNASLTTTYNIRHPNPVMICRLSFFIPTFGARGTFRFSRGNLSCRSVA